MGDRRFERAEQIARRRAHLNVRLRTDNLRTPTVRPSPESNNHAHQVFGAHLLDHPPAATVGQLGLNQRQVRPLISSSFDGRLVSVCFGDDLEPVQRA
jgi:hypothetical protein